MARPDEPRVRAVLAGVNAAQAEPPAPWRPSGEGASQQPGIQSVDFAFSVLAAIEPCRDGLPLNQIAKRVGAQPSKVHHYLVSLTRTGALEQVSDGNYRLGPFALQLGYSALAQQGDPQMAIGRLSQFRDRTGEAAFLSAWSQRGPTILHRVHGNHLLSVEVEAGAVLPLLTSATGRAFVAFLDSTVWAELARLEMISRPDISVEARERIVQEAHAHGLVSIRGAFHPRIAALAAPVWGRDGTLRQVMTSLGWVDEFDADPGGPTAQALLDEARALSTLYGHRP